MFDPAVAADGLMYEEGGVHTGTMWVNLYGYIDPMDGFSGTKLSGYGRKGKSAHLDTYFYTKSVYMQL